MYKKRISDQFIKLIEIVEKLRSPDGCSWDKKQTPKSLLPYFLEETYEVIESVDSENWDNLKEELGDVLLHVILQTQIGIEHNRFNFVDLLDTVNRKLISRHPSVFTNDKTNTELDNQKKNWEELKLKEQNRNSRLDGVPLTLPALNRAQRLQEKASYAGFDWDDIGSVWEKVEEEIEELKEAQLSADIKLTEEELGDLLFSIVNLSRFLNISSEDALRNASKKFTNRFYKLEKILLKEGKTFKNVSSKELNVVWDKVKKDI
tara:strand:- start:1010 stop:1795 length:786 start_codon:yes stop_codon:yes gene_type:complete